MIPNFPHFKSLELSDRGDIEKFTIYHIPYSDFVFENIWAWDIQGKTILSILNNNLVVILEDIVTGKLICSFIGNNKVNETIDELFNFQTINPSVFTSIGLVPESSLTGIDLSRFYIEIDLNNSDYVYNVRNVATFEGHKFYKKRKLYDTFLQKFPESELSILDIHNSSIKESIITLNNLWIEHKNNFGNNIEDYREHQALERLFELNIDKLITLGVLYKQRLIGYIISKILHGHYAIGLFGKFDRSFHGLNEYMMSSCAQKLAEQKCYFFNAGEDLGLQGLRISKNSYVPITILRKYSINKL